jgi:hypothetical protein
MRRDVEVVAWFHRHQLVVVLELQLGFAFQHDNPLMFLLIVPKAVGTAVARRNNPLDADLRIRCENFRKFLG